MVKSPNTIAKAPSAFEILKAIQFNALFNLMRLESQQNVIAAKMWCCSWGVETHLSA